jgi:uncharacterized protein (DUF1778 family)
MAAKRPPSYPQVTNSDNLRLSLEEQQRFAETLLNPPAPNEKLKKAMGLYFENVWPRG